MMKILSHEVKVKDTEERVDTRLRTLKTRETATWKKSLGWNLSSH